MARYRKVASAFALLGIVSILTTMTACSPSQMDMADMLGENIKTVSNVKLEERGDEHLIEKYELIGADVIKSSFDFDVKFNGVAALTDKSQGFTSLTYEVPSTCFENVDKDASYKELYAIFENIIKNYEPVNVEVSPVQDVMSINNAFIQNEVSPFEDYNIREGLLYNLGTPTFNDEENKVTFDTKTLVELRSTKVKPGYGLGVGFSGGVGLGFGVFVSPKEGVFTLQDTYSFVVDKETYESMKNDHSLVYNYCAEAIKNRDSSKIEAVRKSTTSVTYNKADLLKELDIQEIENEFSK